MRLCNRLYSENVICVTYSECVCVCVFFCSLGIQHAMRMHYLVICDLHMISRVVRFWKTLPNLCFILSRNFSF